MKKIMLSLAIATISLASYKKADAQVSVQINLGGLFSAAINSVPTVPVAPVAADDYYYYNDINCYYDVANSQYIYPDNGMWYYSTSVPVIFQNYDFRSARYSRMDRRAFMGRGINAQPYSRQMMMANRGNYNAPMMNRGYNNRMDDRRMEQDRYAQQQYNRQAQMQDRQQFDHMQRNITMNNRDRGNYRESSHRDHF